MKILTINASTGIPHGPVVCNLLLDSVDLEGGKYILSLRDEMYLHSIPKPILEQTGVVGTFSMGRAKARVTETLDNGSRRMYRIAIEGSDVSDFIDLYDAIYARIGIPFEQLPIPKRHFEDLSFVRGLRNDLRSLRQFIANRWRMLRESRI